MAKDLITCEELSEKIKDGIPADTVLVDVSWSSHPGGGLESYEKCHIPGAVHLNVLDADHSDLYPRNIPTQERFQRLARQAGISDSTHVIIYSDSNNFGFFMSCRAWWTFKIYGHDKLSVLDGGLQKWRSLNLPVTSGPNTKEIQEGSFHARWEPRFYKTFGDIAGNIERKELQVSDTRSPQAFLGEDGSSPGHIPGAMNIPATSLTNPADEKLLSVDEARSVFSAQGIDLSRPIVTHCNSGMSSCTVAFTAYLCGYKDVAVYQGGFTEWRSKATPDMIVKNVEK